MTIGVIVQARMGSNRLPGKILKKVLDKPLLQFEIERLARCRAIDALTVATSSGPLDDPVEELLGRLDITCYRGSEEDVLDRYYQAAVLCRFEHIVRISGDCPLIDPGVVDRVVRFYLDHIDQFEYVNNISPRTFPSGQEVEVFSFRSLATAREYRYSRQNRMRRFRQQVTMKF